MNGKTSTSLRSDANRCFVCGPENPAGLRVRFRLDGQTCRAEYAPTADQCGYDGVTHGGILFSLLDDVMANWLFLQGERAYTAKCEIRYREPAPVESVILLEGKLLERRGRRAVLHGKAFNSDGSKVLAEATGTFIVIAD